MYVCSAKRECDLELLLSQYIYYTGKQRQLFD